MHTRIADKLDAQHPACPVLHEFQRDRDGNSYFTVTPLLPSWPVSECSEAHSGGGQFCSDLRKLRDLQKWQPSQSEKSRDPRFTRAKEKYEN